MNKLLFIYLMLASNSNITATCMMLDRALRQLVRASILRCAFVRNLVFLYISASLADGFLFALLNMPCWSHCLQNYHKQLNKTTNSIRKQLSKYLVKVTMDWWLLIRHGEIVFSRFDFVAIINQPNHSHQRKFHWICFSQLILQAR